DRRANHLAVAPSRTLVAQSDDGHLRALGARGAETPAAPFQAIRDGPGRDRTCDLGIKSPLLYQLSYRPRTDQCRAHRARVFGYNRPSSSPWGSEIATGVAHVDRSTAEQRSQRWTLVAVCATTFMLLVDITIVNVALPSIQRRLHASLTGLQWVVDAYAITLAALILTAGALADRYGRRLVFTSGIVVFGIASLLCGIAWNVASLDIARAIQGIGGAALFATALALIGAEYSGAARGRAIAIWGSTVGLAVASGPLIGGILTDALSWRWIFFVNV